MILWNPCTLSKLLQKDTQFVSDVKKQTGFWIICNFKTIPWINTYFKRCSNYTVLACNPKRIYLCWVSIIWKLQCQANPHRWLAQTKVLSITAFFFLNNTSMYEKHISWKQWNSLKIYSTFHKPNKPVPARARKKWADNANKSKSTGKAIQDICIPIPPKGLKFSSELYKNYFPCV